MVRKEVIKFIETNVFAEDGSVVGHALDEEASGEVVAMEQLRCDDGGRDNRGKE